MSHVIVQDPDAITPLIANHVINFFSRDEGFTPGGFFSAFYELASRADEKNLENLRKGFPTQIKAFQLARLNPAGLDQLRIIATKLTLVG